MQVVCAWCGQTVSGEGKGGPVSHGICPACAFTVEHTFHRSLARRSRVRLLQPRRQQQQRQAPTLPLPGFGLIQRHAPDSATR